MYSMFLGCNVRQLAELQGSWERTGRQEWCTVTLNKQEQQYI